MKLATFAIDRAPNWGMISDNEVSLLADRWPTLKAAIAAGALDEIERASRSAKSAPLASIEWLPPIPNPAKILCVGLNYESHRLETGRAIVGHPTIFTRFADSQTAHDAPIRMPAMSDMLDYEGELAVVIGKPGHNIAAADALDHVAGYACYNDGSVRDWQNHSHQFTPGKNFVATGAFGPWLITADEFGAIGPQRLQTRLNGTVMQDALLDQMIFPVATIIEYCSTFTPLAAGDVIVSGTPGGVGMKRNPPVYMKEGDTVEVEIDGIGILRNKIVRVAA